MKKLYTTLKKETTFLILLFFIIFSATSQTTYYVSSSGNNSDNGSQAAPFRTITYAISQAVADDIIHVLGTITENNIQVNKTLTIEGNTPGTSIVQAQEGNPHNEIPRAPVANNRVFRLTSAASTVTFNNLTIRHGNLASAQGGAIYASVEAGLNINNCNILNNYTTNQGAAISVKGSLNISNSSFVSNIAGAAAGAVYHNTSVYDSAITNCLFYQNNSATNNGAAMFIKSKVVTLNNNTIAFNTCDAVNKTEGVHYGYAGKLVLTNNILFNNIEADNDKDGGLDLAGSTPTEVISKNNIISYASNTVYYDDNQSITLASGNYVNAEEVDASKIVFGDLTLNNDGLYYLPVYSSSIAKDAADAPTASTTDINGALRINPDIGSYEAGTGANLSPLFVSPSNIKIAEDIPSYQIIAYDDEPLLYNITDGLDKTKLSISATGILTFNTAPVYDAPADANLDNIYEIEITISDGIGGTTAKSFEVEVTEQNYNVLMIVLDDLNDYIGVMGGHPQAKTPNIDKMAGEGVLFTNAYSNAPLCAPSRASFLSGVLPTSSGLYGTGNFKSFPALKNSKMISEYMMDNGYTTYKTGKITHSASGEDVWWDYVLENSQDYGPLAYNGNRAAVHPFSTIEMAKEGGSLDGSFGSLANIPSVPADASNPGYTGWYSTTSNAPFSYVNDGNRDLMPDEKSVEWITEQLEMLSDANSKDPFLMAAGLIRPHSPFIVPQKYFDLFPLEDIQLPNIFLNDIADLQGNLGDRGFNIGAAVDQSYTDKQEGIRRYLQAYLASIAFADDMVGQLMTALENSNYADNTLVLLFSDHGYAIGEKDYMWKYNLWKQTSRVPLIIKSPKHKDKAGMEISKPVTLVDIFPTIKDFCKLTGDTKKNGQGVDLDGHSLMPLLDDPINGVWEGNEEALIVVERWGYFDPSRQNYALATNRYRYIKRAGGEEEFYDHQYDPNEWFNMANESAYTSVISAFRENLIKHTYPSIVIEDQMQDFSKMSSHSNLKLSTLSTGNMGESDSDQVQKITSDVAEIVYELDGLNKFSIDFWNTNDGSGPIDVGELKAYVAGLDEIYTEVTMSYTSSRQTWNTANTLLFHTPTSPIPEGSKYLKIEWISGEEPNLDKGYISAIRLFDSDPVIFNTGIETIPVTVDPNLFQYDSSQLREVAPELPTMTDTLDNLNMVYANEGCLYITGQGEENTNYLDDSGRAVRCVPEGGALAKASLTYQMEELDHFRVEFFGKSNLTEANHDTEVGVIKTYIAGEDEQFTEISNKMVELRINSSLEQFAIVPDANIPTDTKFFKVELEGGTNAWLGQFGAVHLYGEVLNPSLSSEEVDPGSAKWSISPVPATSKLKINGLKAPVTYQVISILGAVQAEGVSNGQVDISFLKNGFYLLVIDSQIALKFIKM